MRYVSTRGATPACGAGAAIVGGLAADGGLYVPQHPVRFVAQPELAEADLPTVAKHFLAPFFAGDPLADELDAICDEAFNFPVELLDLPDEPLTVLELFHGPTAAFKDFGARFLAACMARVEAANPRPDPLTILVATSGDTGGAVAAAFHGRPGMAVDVFYPAGMVSPRQEQQLTCWGGNVRAFRVAGRFDDCQKLVKAAFVDPALAQKRRFSSANSINLGRLLPQAAYYVWASLQMQRRCGHKPSFIVPTGNLGNGLACAWARSAGAPIERIHFVTNANRTIVDFFKDGQWVPRTSIATLANAMDVGNPSNMERLRVAHTDDTALRSSYSASSVSDEQIADQIRHDFSRRGQVFCPHTATAMFAYDQLPEADKQQQHHVVVATAHPAKFETIVEPLIGTRVAVPANLQALLDLPAHAQDLSPDLASLRTFYEASHHGR